MKKKQKKKIWQLITEKTWCKNAFYKKSKGVLKHCAVGWIWAHYPGKGYAAIKKLAKVVKKTNKLPQPQHLVNVADWNDDPKTTFRQVKKAFRLANI